MLKNNNVVGKKIDLSHEKAVEYGRKGGIANGEKAKRKKVLRDLTRDMLYMQERDSERLDQVMEFFPDMKKEEVTQMVVMVASLLNKAKDGDVKAFEVIRDTAGFKPVDKLEIVDDSDEFSENDVEILKESAKKVFKLNEYNDETVEDAVIVSKK